MESRRILKGAEQMKAELNELLRLKMEAESIYGICKDVSKEEFERRIDAYKK